MGQTHTGQAGGRLPPSDDPPFDGAQQAARLLTQLAEEAGDRMQSAASRIDHRAFKEAASRQRDVLDRVNQIFMAVAPWVKVLQRATEQQEALVESSQASHDGLEENPPTDSDDTSEETSHDSELPEDRFVSSGNENRPTGTSEPPLPIEFPELAWQQSRITDWSRMLVLKAEAELHATRAQQPATGARQQAAEPAADAGRPDPDPAQPPDDQGEPVKQPDPGEPRETLKRALQKAIELGPDARKHSESAAQHLSQEDIASALPDQQEVLRLLKEIAELLPKQDQQEENQQPSGGENNEKKPQSQEQQPQEQQQERQPQKQQQNEKSSREQAMSVLRRAGERERQHRDLQKQLQQILGDRLRVDKDW